MRVFVTGGTGFVGPAVVRELINAGHQVLGLARSDSSAAVLTGLGADVHRGGLTDLQALRDGAQRCDGVVHLAVTHGVTDLSEALEIDRRALNAFADILESRGGPLVFASATSLIAPGSTITELDAGDQASAIPRARTETEALQLADRGVRVVAVRLATLVHGVGDVRGFAPMLIEMARARGVSAYVGDGSNRWPAIHQLDAAVILRLALEGAPAGSRLHAVAEEGIPFRAIAEAIGTGLAVPVTSLDPGDVDDHFYLLGGPIAALTATEISASNTVTREMLTWEPAHPTLLDDLGAGFYFRPPTA